MNLSYTVWDPRVPDSHIPGEIVAEYYELPRAGIHHWTPGYVMREFMPRLMGDLGFRFEHSMYDALHYVNESESFGDVCWVYGGLVGIEYHDLIKEIYKKTTSILDIMDLGNLTTTNPYQSLFIGWHSISRIKNRHSITGRRLLVNCDSMSIPVIPLIVPYYADVLVLDNRDGRTFRTYIDKFAYDDYIELFTVSNRLNNKAEFNRS